MEEAPKKQVNIFELLNTAVKPIFIRIKKWLWIPPVLFAIVFVWGYYNENKKPTIYKSIITYILEDEIANDAARAQVGGLLSSLSASAPSNKAMMNELGGSNKLIEQTLLSKVKLEGKEILLIHYYIDKFGYGGSFKNKNPYGDAYAVGSDQNLDYMLRMISSSIRMDLSSELSESGLLVLYFKSTDELFAKLFPENHLNTISKFYIEKRTERSKNMLVITRRKRDSLLMLLQGKTYGAANAADNLFGAVMKRARVNEVQVNRDLGILNEQYAQSAAAYSSSLLELERSKPFISVVDDIRLPLAGDSPKPIKKAFTLGFIGLFLGLAVIIGVFLGSDYLKKQKKEYLLLHGKSS